jgi:predicted RNA-binding protein with PIN domain
MNFLVDGHNLIPKIGGLSLRSLDDEQRLIELLQVFCRVRRHQVEVFFDQAPPGRAGRKRAGMVVVHFVRQGRTADDAIAARLVQLRKAAQNWTVVSSDRQVQREARDHHAAILPSEQFAGELHSALQASPQGSTDEPAELSEEEIKEWLELFGKGRD